MQLQRYPQVRGLQPQIKAVSKQECWEAYLAQQRYGDHKEPNGPVDEYEFSRNRKEQVQAVEQPTGRYKSGQPRNRKGQE